MICVLQLTFVPSWMPYGKQGMAKDSKAPSPVSCQHYNMLTTFCKNGIEHSQMILMDNQGEFLGGKVSRVRATSLGEAKALAAELAVDYILQFSNIGK
ncbi:hypothetical protein IFM89_038333, partial [Coptis chinensis]